MLNRDLYVQVWNARAEDQWGLRSDEVWGRSFASLDIGLPVDRILPLIRACLADASREEHLDIRAVNRRGKPVNCHVTILAQSRDEEEILGVIVLVDDGTSPARRR